MDIHLLAGTRLFHGIREHEIEAGREDLWKGGLYIQGRGCDRPSGGGDGGGCEHH